MHLFDGPKIPWTQLSLSAPGALWEARLEMHHAFQVVGAVGHTFVAPRPAEVHTAATWLPELRALIGHPLKRGGGRVALCPADLAVLVFDEGMSLLAETTAVGKTPEDLLAWVGEALNTHFDLPPAQLKFPTYAPPPREEGPFRAPAPGDLAQLSRAYDNAHSILTRLDRNLARAEIGEARSEVLIWPHHADIALLVTLSGSGEDAPSIGVGMVPGDGDYRDPYYYVAPWPKLNPKTLPPLKSDGHWHTEGWVGGVWEMTPERGGWEADAQGASVMAFVAEAFEASLGRLKG